ncbi:acyl-CoA carboxylase subunit beta [Rubrivirga marina]|uniref:acyl-CoA carboxylase subunit beta n=1 Tax=Rubrivirga marina TaxID=1196024 RepID=UPI000BA94FA6|nr:acyl-CoA carboxylase subunit beta [Rubrivirga marina]
MSVIAAPDRPFPLGSPAPDDGPQREAYDRRVAFHRRQLDALEQQAAEIRRGGGTRAIQRQHDRGKLTARERIDALLDDPADFREIGLFVGRGMYEDEGGCPAGGTVMGLGHVSGRLCMIVANDSTVKAGAWFPITAKKNLRAQEIALENRVPILYLVDSAGVFLPMQDEIFPDRDHFGRIFRNNARLSALGVPQIAAIMGSCVAGGAYLPIMSDESLIVDGTGSVFLAGPFLVQAAIGEEVDVETLGGATTQTDISGVCEYKMPDDETCLATVRDLVAGLGPLPRFGFTRDAPEAPAFEPEEVFGVFPESRQQPYDTRELLARIVDRDSWTEVKAGYGQTLVCGYARLDGWSVGIVASQRQVVRAKAPKGKAAEMQIGGVIYGDAADKAARFVMQCNQKRIPLIFFQDATGFMVGTRAEQGGIIKDGAKLVNAVANSVVPTFTVVVGNSFGAANYALNGRAYDPRLMLAWPSAQIAVMGGSQAAKTLLSIEERKLQKQGIELSDADRQARLDEIEARYAEQTTPVYAAARLWVDAIIDPRETRDWLATGLEMADHNPDMADFKVGVLQT